MKVLLVLCFVLFNLYGEEFIVNNEKELKNALIRSQNNHQSDTIILKKGTYKVYDKAFTFFDNQNYDLTLKSENTINNEEVILDGQNQSQILSFSNTKTSTLELKGITIINGLLSQTAGIIFSNQNIRLENCKIENVDNYFKSLYALKGLQIVSSTFN